MPRKYEDCDFHGWATKYDLLCADGRTIKPGAFAHQNGQKVPLVWAHQHDAPDAVLGHGFLESRPEGMYIYGYFNDSPMGKIAKQDVQHGDLTAISIWANKLKQDGGNVMHGLIREASLVLAGANPGASIEYVSMAHGEESEDEAWMFMGEDNAMIHTAVDEMPEEITEEVISHEDKGDNKMAEPEKKTEGSEKTVQDVLDTLNEEQKKAVYYIIGAALSDEGGDDEAEHSDEGVNEMNYNAFDSESAGVRAGTGYISHDDMEQILKDAKSLGSLKEAVLMHMDDGVLAHDAAADAAAGIVRPTGNQNYFVRDPEMLFPEYRSNSAVPEFITGYTMGWVDRFLAAVHRSPVSRIKSMFADITEDEARALGYIKGHLKKEEFFTLIKRTTDPQTIYKKQKMDRDDVIDIVDFDVIAWIRAEMRVKLNEEIARACLVGDGRLSSSDDKIQETHIRPVVSDHELFVEEVEVDTSDVRNIWEAAIRSRKAYKGSGNMTCYLTADTLSDMLLYTDETGRDLFKNESELATKMRVAKFEEVEMIDGVQRNGKNVLAILMNPSDYTIGADKGGQVAMFDDFDIDYNQMKYLIETRCSGCLTKPKSAIVLVAKESENP